MPLKKYLMMKLHDVKSDLIRAKMTSKASRLLVVILRIKSISYSKLGQYFTYRIFTVNADIFFLVKLSNLIYLVNF